MRVICDIEANGLEAPDKVWLIVCKDIDTDEYHIFRNPSLNPTEKERFHAFTKKVTKWIGHNWLEYDYPVLHRLLSFTLDNPAQSSLDTLIISRMVDYSRPAGHSIDAYGKEFGYEKLSFHKFTDKELEDDNSALFLSMEDYCKRDVDITHRVYDLHARFINDRTQYASIDLEQQFQLVVNSLHNAGFAFNTERARKLLEKVTEELNVLDTKIESAFPARLRLVREIHPKTTLHGTLNKSDFRWVRGGDLSEYNGGPFCRCVWKSFNPSSHKQLIEVLAGADWEPIEKTQTHIDFERELRRASSKRRTDQSDTPVLSQDEIAQRRDHLGKYGWKINEVNLATLPQKAPTPARLLAKRILLESRRRTLTEWLALVREDGRIHGRFYGIGAWTHRMAHQKPNVANIPNEFKEDGSVKLLGKEMRSLWQAPRKRLLVGVDAEGIQLRIFAHYVNDPMLIDALVKGDKKLKTDPHSYNRGVLNGPDGSEVCRTRQAAKRFLYALFLGAGIERLAHILGSSRTEAEDALARLLTAYPGFAFLKQNVIPADARRGYFIGIDGRRVPIPGSDVGERKHLCMSGYLQNGESVVIKRAAVIAAPQLAPLDAFLVDIVHDEFQAESPNDMRIALQVAKILDDAIVAAGELYKLKCPMAGSYWNDDHGDYTIGTNWMQTH